ncbi:MAG TPA: hypothetical protein VFG05_04935 [Methylocella sp.]|nr:hypothetical protein [Methylocella sp.]
MMRSSETLSFKQHFGHLRRSGDVLCPYRDPGALLDHLHSDDGSAEEKNAILSALVAAAQREGPAREAAGTLLWLALWPGLDALYRRLLRHFRAEPEELVAEIAARLTHGIARVDLALVSRIAATLLRNIERDIRRDLAARRREEALRADMPNEAVFGNEPPDQGEDLAGLLSALPGRDAGLLIAIFLRGESQLAASRWFGVSHDAARKRVQRAIRRLREGLKNFFDEACPIPASATAFRGRIQAKPHRKSRQ